MLSHLPYRLNPPNYQTCQGLIQRAPVSKVARWTTKGILDHKYSMVKCGKSLGCSTGHHFVRAYCAF